jgi:gas vesicle protein
MNNTGKILTAVAAGATAGAILGILFAPEKGCETRKKINEQGKKITGELKDKIRIGKEKLTNLKTDMQKTVKESLEEMV